MKALVFESIRNPIFQDVPIPGIGPHNVLIRVKAAGICRIDAQIYEGLYQVEFPLIPGHEFSGVVEDIGEQVTTVAVGDRVTADPHTGCGRCYYCRIHQYNQCQNLQVTGITKDGAFAEYVIAPEEKVFHIGNLTFQEAAMVEPIACAVYALKQIAMPTGAEALIFGAGTRGLILLQLLKHSGASRVVIVEPQHNRIELAYFLGADKVVLADGDEHELLQEFAPTGFDVVIDTTGIPDVVEKMPAVTRNSGILLYFGRYPKDKQVCINPYDIFQRDLKIYGAFALRSTFVPALRLLKQNIIQVAPLVSHEFSLDEFQEALWVLSSGIALKVQLKP